MEFRKNVALLNVFYKQMTGYSYQKDERYGIDDFICKWSSPICFDIVCHIILIFIVVFFSFFLKSHWFLFCNISLCCILASIGGLLGLGFGFSVISAIEFVYFFGIRLIFYNKREATIATANSIVTITTTPKANKNVGNQRKSLFNQKQPTPKSH